MLTFPVFRTAIREDVFQSVKSIATNHENGEVHFMDGTKMIVDDYSASSLVSFYNSLNDDRKTQFIAAVNNNAATFMKALNSALSRV